MSEDSGFGSHRTRSDVRSRYPGLTLTSLFPPTSYKSHDLLPWTYRLPPRHKAHLIPVEIFSEIFLYTVQDDPHSQTNLMLVCRNWHNIMLSTPGIHSQLRIYGWTEKKDVERFGRRWLLDVIVNIQHLQTNIFGDIIPGVDPVESHACIMAAADAASRWRSLALLSFPAPGGYKDLKIIHPLQHLESFKLAASCDLGNFLEPLITAITTTVTPGFTVMEVLHPDAALHLVQPAHFPLFSFLTTLRLICGRMQNPVDILPSLNRLEIFEAHRLSLPIYSPGVDLPLTQILRVLHLKSVSIQWMEGRTFPALEECSIIFPHHLDVLQSVYLPSCSILKYHSNNLRTLEHFLHPPLAILDVKCGQWRRWRGNLQLTTLHPIFAVQSLTCLHLEIKCSERLLSYMLGLAPSLEELWMGLSNPHALSCAFLLAFAAGGRNTSVGLSSRAIAPLCRQLRKLHLHYKRWSRDTERNALIPAFGAIVASHPAKEQAFSFRLSFGEGSELQEWIVHEPVERFDIELQGDRTFIGVSSPLGIVPLSRASVGSDYRSLTGLEYPPLPRETEYIATNEDLELPIDYFFSFHSLKEMRMRRLSLGMRSNTQSSPNAPLFHTLKVLIVHASRLAPLAGQTFHKLERYQENFVSGVDEPRQDQLTEMPVCTRLVTSLSRLATLKLPQVRELEVLVDQEEEPDYLWEKYVAVNTRLSGLKLLSLSITDGGTSYFSDIPKTLGSLPALETLVLHALHLDNPYVTFFEAFIPMNAQGTSEPIWEGQIPKVLCPRLESLQIEDIDLIEQPAELMPVLKNIVTLRAILGSPLKSFTFYDGYPGKKKWELIGRDGGFTMEEVVPAQRFKLDI